MSDLALAQFLAVLTAFGFASGDTCARFALRTSTPITATLIVSCITLAMYGPFALDPFFPEHVSAFRARSFSWWRAFPRRAWPEPFFT